MRTRKSKRGVSGLLQAISRRQFMQGAGVAAVGLTVTGMPKLAAAEEKKLSFYNWDTYIAEDTLDNFKDATGIEVKMDLFADNAELFAKLRDGNPGYDLIVPTNDWVARMVAAGMLEELDHSLIPNMSNLYPSFMDKAPFDPGRKHSLPYMWGSIGIGYRKSKVSEPPASWKYLYDSDQYSGKIAILAEPQTALQMGMKYLGYSLNSTNKAEIDAAADLLIKQKPHIKAFAEDNGQDLLAAGDVDLTMEWNGDIAQLMTEDDDVGYVMPVEGGLLWEDTLCIPKGAPHPGNAHAFINYIYEPDVNRSIAEYIQYATPNKTAAEGMPAEYKDNPAIYPPEADLAKAEKALYLGEDIVEYYDQTYTKVLAS
ncbi:ABC transporter substrate-binding protein [Rhodovibrionaceae bacterium A322]